MSTKAKPSPKKAAPAKGAPKTKPTETTPAAAPEIATTVLRKGSCPTLSRKSQLTYELGQDPAKAFHFRIVSCDGGGFFSPEWIAWTAIQAAIKKSVGPLTSLCLRPLLKGKSVNSSGYLLAALVAEGLLEPLPDKIRHFRLTGDSPTADEVKPRSAPANKAKATNPKASKA